MLKSAKSNDMHSMHEDQNENMRIYLSGKMCLGNHYPWTKWKQSLILEEFSIHQMRFLLLTTHSYTWSHLFEAKFNIRICDSAHFRLSISGIL